MTIDAYPLAWPIGWPRTRESDRIKARFSKGERIYSSQPDVGSWMNKKNITIAQATNRVLAELSRFGVPVGAAIISTNVRTKLNGLPYSHGRGPDDPGVAIYWERPDNRARKCMAIDIYDGVAGNMAAIAATLNAMRAIERHGGAKILDRAFVGFEALPAPGNLAKREWWDILECARDSSPDVIKQQYRRLASDNHPDKGGTQARMAEINKAYSEATT